MVKRQTGVRKGLSGLGGSLEFNNLQEEPVSLSSLA